MDLYEAISRRRDTRHFLSDAVPSEILDRALSAAIAAPSVGLSQPWRFIDISSWNRQLLFDNFAHMRQEAEVGIAVPEQKQLYQSLKLEALKEAPILLACFCAYPSEDEFTLGIIGQRRSLEWSCACAIQNLWLSLTAEGYGAGWVTILDLPKLKAQLECPLSWEPLGVLCIGKPATDYGQKPMLEQLQWRSPERKIEEFYQKREPRELS